MKTTKIVDLQSFTRLPLTIVSVAEKSLPDIFVQTPIGTRQVRLKQEHYPFLFGSVSQIEKHASSIIQELQKIEEESIDYLITKWKETL